MEPALNLRQGTPIDATLLLRIAARDEAALSDLIGRHGRGIRGVATRYLKDPAAAEDIVQETFLKVWTHAERFDPDKGSAKGWIYRIATNLCTDRYRRQRLGYFFGFGPETPEPEDDVPDIERQLSGRQELAQIRNHIDALPARQRMALLLSVGGDLGTEEISRAMNTSHGAVEQLLVRARRKLREVMATPEGDTGKKGKRG